MAKTFKAYGILYTAEDVIGTSGFTIDQADLESIVAASPRSIPLITDVGHMRDTESVIGHVNLELTGDHREDVYAELTFNPIARREYETMLQSVKGREALRLGFMLRGVHVNKNENKITDGYISVVFLNETGLGGHIDKFGWEDSDE